LECSIAILAGGQSKRLGLDKALIAIHGDGRPLIAHQIETLQPLTNDLSIVGPERPGYRALNAPLALDDYPGEGPLGGIATALRRAQHERVLVVACDLPFLSLPLLRWMLELDRSRAAIVPCIPGRSRQGTRLARQSTHAIYSRSSLAGIEIALERGIRQAAQVLANIETLNLPVEQLVRFDPGLRSFFSINTPEERDQAVFWLKSRTNAPVKEIDTIY
jgi:molybdopterin-guanine dinucleotide biosynthesis protein A